jgi:uncharacterized protein YjbI with pentapeptide repeats
MKIMKPSRIGVLTRPYRYQGKEQLGIGVAMMTTLGDAPTLLTDQQLWNTVGAELGGHTLDLALPKRHAEFLAIAHAYGRYCDSTRSCEASIRVGARTKRLRVSGERRWETWRNGVAQPFDSLPIDWPFAFGGADHPDNPDGRGYSPDSSVAEWKGLLPNVEYADDRLHAPGQQVASASLTPVSASRPARREMYGELDQQWWEEDYPGFPRTMDPRYFNVAPLDQQFLDWHQWPDGVEYEMVHLHPSQERIVGRTLALRARAFVTMGGTGELAEVPMRLTTLWFIPHRERVVMIFHGTHRIGEFDASDVDCLLLGAEWAGQPKSTDTYQNIYTLRIDKKQGLAHALRDRDLLPEALLAAREASGEEGPPVGEGLLLRNFMNRLNGAIPQQAPAPTPLPEVESPPASLDELADRVEGWLQQAQQAEQKLRDHIDGQRNTDLTLLQAQADSAAKKTRAQGPKSDQQYQLYRHSVQHRSPAPRPRAEESAALRQRVQAIHARGGSLAALNLAGVDLSGLDLRGAKLDRAELEGADLRDTILVDASLRQAVLARADLTRAVLRGADLSEANLSLARCDATDFVGATLSSCTIEDSRFERCDFSRATIDRARFQRCEFRSSYFRQASLSNLVFFEQAFVDVDFSGATIRKLVLVQCDVGDLRFSDAQITGFALIEAPTVNALRFDNATLTKACFLKGEALDGADFSCATLKEVNLHGASLRHSNFRGAKISSSDLSDTSFEGADLRDVRLEQGYLVRADLRGANLQGADLLGAMIRRARLGDADLRQANLFRANLAEIAQNSATRFEGAYCEGVVWNPRARKE